MHNSSPDGVHYLIEFFGCDRKQLNSVTFWKRILMKSVSGTSMKVLHSHFYKFNPEGLTGYLLLSTSHISVHTQAELRYAACDVFSCAGDDETEKTVRHTVEMVTHDRVKIKKLKRGFRVTAKIQPVMDIYTPLEEAKEEIWRRWKNASLREKVTNYLGQIPPLINQEPRAYLDRTVISPDNEYTNFIEKAKKANLRYIGFEYLKDKFVTINPDKFGLARMAFTMVKTGVERQ